MRTLTAEFKQLLAENKHNYLVYADITLQDSTVLNLTNQHIWNGGFIVENAISEDDNFTALGSVVIGSAELVINNIDETYSEYDFTNANVVMRIGLQLTSTTEIITLGTYTVDEAQYNGATIHLYMLDYVEQFDRPYSLCGISDTTNYLSYPATLLQIAQNACLCCGVTLGTTNFPNRNYSVASRPTDDSITFREVLSWVATIAGCYVQARYDGKIELKWFDTSTLDEYTQNDLTFNPWNDDAALDGGTFNPWNDGDTADGGTFTDGKRSKINFISSLYSQNIAVDDVVITGVSVAAKDESTSATDTIKYYTAGSSGYIISVESNPFITTSTGQTIANYLATQLVGLRFRKLSIIHASDPAIEVGDFAIIKDRKQNVYYAIATRVRFSADGNQTFVCGASTPLRNSSTRYSTATKSYVEARKILKAETTSLEQAIDNLAQTVANSSGLWTTKETSSSGTIWYLHNKSSLAASNIVWKMTANAWAVTTNYQGASTQWNAGGTADGDLIAQILSTDGVNANWIRTGTLAAARIASRSLSADKISGGTLKLGGQNGANGLLEIYNNSNVLTGKFDQIGVRVFNNGYLASFADETAFENFDGRICELTGGDVIIGMYNDAADYNPSDVQIYGKFASTEIPDAFMDTWPVAHLGYASPVSASALTLGEWTGTNKKTADIYMAFQKSAIVTNGNDEDVAQYYWSPIFVKKRTTFNDSIYVAGTIYSKHSKPRVVDTQDYATRLLYCYETPSPCFGDIGTGKTDSNGECYVFLDDILKETINMEHEYVVFLQKEGVGDIWVDKKEAEYFIVKGTPNLSFSWELKAKQFDATSTRFEELKPQEEYIETNPDDEYTDIDYASEGAQLVEDYINILEGTA